jgi:coenzyme F420-0:L-glutamate ligase / coenzyme F420-1:gamma-L-glutamate ligase
MLISSLTGIPLVQPGDDLVKILIIALSENSINLTQGDIIVVAQKIVSKSEGRLVCLQNVKPSPRAYELSSITKKDARLVELVLEESREVLRAAKDVLIVEHKRGFICANAGIDHSNVQGPGLDSKDWVLLLPEDSDASANKIREGLEEYSGLTLGVMIIDSHGRAWRKGTVGVSIGMSGIPGLVDLRGEEDLYGNRLRVSEVGAGDELAAAASLVMGQASERTPLVHVRGFPYPLRESCITEIFRPRDIDLFR